MAFSELELKVIDRTVGALCRRKSLPQFADELRIVYEVDGNSVSIFEERPPWNGVGEWTRQGIARFRCVRSRRLWRLYWMRQDLKWHLFKSGLATPNLAELAALVEENRYGAFLGWSIVPGLVLRPSGTTRSALLPRRLRVGTLQKQLHGGQFQGPVTTREPPAGCPGLVDWHAICDGHKTWAQGA
jgi:hypothetical protein